MSSCRRSPVLQPAPRARLRGESPPKFLLPAEADGQAKKRAREHGARGDGSRRRKSSLETRVQEGSSRPSRVSSRRWSPDRGRARRNREGLELALNVIHVRAGRSALQLVTNV